MSKRYSDEVREAVINAIESGMSHEEITAQFGPSRETQAAWQNQHFNATGPKKPDREAGSLSARERELQAELEELQEQVTILQHAASYFAAKSNISPK